MYSVVLLAAMATATETPSFGHKSCHGCYASYASCYGCCGGYNYAGCCGGYAYAGCCGGYAYAAPVRHKHGLFHGCCGGYTYAGCCGGYAYGGCCGGYAYAGCCGGYAYAGCCGGGYLPSYSGCYGGVWGSMSSGCYGGVGGTIVTPPVMVAPAVTVPVAPATKAEVKPSGSAQLRLTLPAEAKLYVDGRLVPGAGTERTFYTPALEPGRSFFYDMKAEVEVAGKVVVDEKRVVVRANDNLQESFPKVIAAVASPTELAAK